MKMDTDLRIRVAAGLLAAVLGSLGAAHAAATPDAPVRYTCPDSLEFVVSRTPQSATVVFGARSYLLDRSRSSIGEKYLSADAALLVDGPSAVFVAEDRHGAGACMAAARVAGS